MLARHGVTSKLTLSPATLMFLMLAKIDCSGAGSVLRRFRFQAMSAGVMGRPSCQVAPLRVRIVIALLSPFQENWSHTPGASDRSSRCTMYGSKIDR